MDGCFRDRANPFTIEHNWDTNTVPGAYDTAVIVSASSFQEVVNNLLEPVVIAGFQVEANATFVNFDPLGFSVIGQTVVNGTISLFEDVSTDLGGITVNAGSIINNRGSLISGNSNLVPSGFRLGTLRNSVTGEVRLNGNLCADIENYGVMKIATASAISNLFCAGEGEIAPDSQILLGSQLLVAGSASVLGVMEITLGATPATSGLLDVQVGVSIGASNLVVKMGTLGPLSAGDGKTLIQSATSLFSDFSLADYSVEGAADEFAYALRLIGGDTTVDSFALLALNDSATGGGPSWMKVRP